MIPSTFDFDDQVVVVTGGSRGVGAGIVTAFLDAGANVVTCGRHEAEVDGAVFVAADIRKPAEAERVIAKAVEQWGRLDVLVNNAGISHADTPGRSLEEIVAAGHLSVAPLEEVHTVFETNVFGVIAVTQAMLPLLREAPEARIVNVASSGGSLTLNSDPTNPHRAMFGTYSASKAAANAVTVAFAAELESAGIKVNAACPGFTATDLNYFRGTRTVEQAAHEPVRLALIGADGPTGTFSNEDGPLPW
jgi:NAD(P)-dependent dehydrogenase (short-subunit alcohol dehydrogenase family)